MYKKRVVLLALLACFLFMSCYTVKVVAPPRKDVTMLAETDAASFRMTKRFIYLIAGLIPISDISTEPLIAQYNLESVKVETKFDIVDYFISAVTGGLVVTKSVTIEGNPRK